MMAKRHLACHFVKVRADIAEKPGAQIGMTFHNLKLIHVQAGRFSKDKVADGHLTHVMKHGRHSQYILLPFYIFH